MKTQTFILMAAIAVSLAYMAARLQDMHGDVGVDGGVPVLLPDVGDAGRGPDAGA